MYVKCKGNFMEVKCFVICTDLLLPLKVNPDNPNPQCQKYAIDSGIRIRRFFGRIGFHGYNTYICKITGVVYNLCIIYK